MSNKPDNFHRMPDICKRTGLPRSTIYRLIKEGTFPKQIKLSERTAVWSESSISDWIEEQKQKAGVA